MFLLSRQSSSEELKEQKSKIFEKKLDIYHKFLEFLEKLLTENELKIDRTQNRDDLKGLLFQLANLKMHTTDEHVNRIFNNINLILQGLKNKDMKEAEYGNLSKNLFAIVSSFQIELYNKHLGEAQLNDEIIAKIITQAKNSSVEVNPLQDESTLDQALKLNKSFRATIFKPIGEKLVGKIKQELILRYGSELVLLTERPQGANQLLLFSLEIRRTSWPGDIRVAIGEIDGDRALFAVRGAVGKPEDSKLYNYLTLQFKSKRAAIPREQINVTGFGWWFPFNQKDYQFQKWTDENKIIMKFYNLDQSVITYIMEELVAIITEVDNYFASNPV